MLKRTNGPADDFLSVPTMEELNKTSEEYVKPITRKRVDQTTSDRFVIQKKNFETQYANIYFERLKKLKPRVIERAKNTWCTSGWIHLNHLIDQNPSQSWKNFWTSNLRMGSASSQEPYSNKCH